MKREAAYLSLMIIFIAVLLSGCGTVSPDPGPKSLSYIPARFYDLMDILELNVGVDSQASFFVVAALEPIAVGGGIYNGEKLGMDGRLFGQWSEKRLELNLGIEGLVRYEKVPNAGNDYLRDAFYCPHHNTVTTEGIFYESWGCTPRILDHERRILELSVELHLLALGIDIGISPLEILDFATGILGIDVISNDDWASPVILKREIPFTFDPPPDDKGEATIPIEES